MMPSAPTTTITPEPVVRLQHYFQEPYNLAIATARTCYSSRVITPEDVDKDEQTRAQRDRIAESIYKAGHHTTIQHPTFQFVIEKVSRQFIWSFLHAHRGHGRRDERWLSAPDRSSEDPRSMIR